MALIWEFYWPVFALAAILGLAAGVVDFHKPRGERNYALLASAGLVALLVGLAWHGPGGAADRLTMSVERAARLTLHNYEMHQVTARLEQGPLKRTLVLSGPADDFQQRELLRIMNLIPGVQSVRWDRPLEPRRGL
jgi:hypothetical protein